MIYLLGGSGYVGQAYQALLTRKGVPFRNVRRADLDYSNLEVLTAALRRDHPEFLINAAGYTGKPNVDACELHKAECLMGNAVLPGTIAQACQAAGVPWGHVSSGLFFQGLFFFFGENTAIRATQAGASTRFLPEPSACRPGFPWRRTVSR